MGFTFRPATRENVGLILGAIGASGSGKTFSALRLAKGMAGDKPFVVIDTENGRAKHYADRFRFDHGDLSAPFSPERYQEAILAADAAGYPVIVVDSASHEHAGDGGILDMQEAELTRMAGDDYRKRDACKMASWIKPKMQHKRMVSKLLQVRAHLILCFRAEEKTEMIKGADGKMVVQPKKSLTGLSGWIPICEKTLPYELTASFLLIPDKPGIPHPIKLQEQHRSFIDLAKPLDESVGQSLAQWARGGTTPTAEKPQSQQSSDKAIVTIDGKQYKTRGVTQAQFDEIRRLEEMVDRIHGEGTAAKFLAQDHRVTKRLHLTLDSAKHYIRTLQLQSGEPVEE